MMDVLAENHSLYPRVGESEDDLRLRQAYHDFDEGKIERSELQNIEDSYSEELINEQIDAGLDIVTDGLVRWYDHISHLAGKLEGAEVAGLVRYFDTNYLVREADVVDHLEWRNPLIVSEYEFAESVSSQPVKMVLPGPFTMAKHSLTENGPYSSDKELAEDYAQILQQEIQALAEAGLNHLQIEEPSLLQFPQESDWVMELNNNLASASGSTETRIATYFGDVVPLYEDLQESEFDILTVDFTYSDTIGEVIKANGSDKRIGLGLLNGRNTKLEDPDEIIRMVRELEPSLPGEEQHLTFSCSIDYLPRNKAQRKLELLSDIRDQLKGD